MALSLVPQLREVFQVFMFFDFDRNAIWWWTGQDRPNRFRSIAAANALSVVEIDVILTPVRAVFQRFGKSSLSINLLVVASRPERLLTKLSGRLVADFKEKGRPP
jgi:hypothetical protein